jgi:hypothetical protein
VRHCAARAEVKHPLETNRHMINPYRCRPSATATLARPRARAAAVGCGP